MEGRGSKTDVSTFSFCKHFRNSQEITRQGDIVDAIT